MGGSEVLLVLIGKRWRGERDAGPARIDEPGDLVRREVASGLAKGMRVIPLLLDGATMPTEAQLPEPLRPLAGRNALALDNARFAADMQRLVATLREALGEPAVTAAVASPPGATQRRGLWAAAAALIIVIIGLAAWWQWRAPSFGGAPVAADTPSATRAAINGEWQAEVTYDWPNARFVERFVLHGEGSELHGSASFLGVPRGVLEGRAGPDGLSFVTRTQESAGGGSNVETVHRYRGQLTGDEIRFVMQTEGGSSVHVPVEFVARRSGAAASQAVR